MNQLALLECIREQTDFGEAQTLALKQLLPLIEGQIPWLIDRFYERIEKDPESKAVIRGGEVQAERLKQTLRSWVSSGLQGPHDQVFLETRARIGRVHVQVEMPQHLMVTAMNGLRRDLRGLLEQVYDGQTAQRQAASIALDAWLDLELALMLEVYRSDSLARLSRSERLATLGELATSIAHDLRNPLGVIKSSLYLLRMRCEQVGSTEAVSRHIDKIDRQVHRCNRIINDLLELVRGRAPKLVPIDALALLRETLEIAGLTETREADLDPDAPQPQAATGPTVLLEIQPQLRLQADPGLLQQALLNLFENAHEALSGREGTITCRVRSETEGGATVIEIEDDGPGIPESILANIFEPLVTGRSRGTGLGLALVHAIATRHGGQVSARNLPSGGAQLRLALPAATSPTSPTQPLGEGVETP